MTVIPISSDRVNTQALAAWGGVEDICNKLTKPMDKTPAHFEPTKDCRATVDYICNEYATQARSSQAYLGKPSKISKCIVAGLVYFEDISIKSFTILMPLQVSGNVKIGDVTVDTDHYYHVLGEYFLRVAEGGKLVAISVSNIM
ncbi:hypothetical protein RJ035_007886 [Blastomyces gilchristii]